MYSSKFTAALFMAYGLVSIALCILGWFWLTNLQPSFPIIPAACFLFAGLTAATSARFYADL